MTFYSDVSLPTFVETNARGGYVWHTRVKTLFSGHERRNQDWSKEIGRWDISYPMTKTDDPAQTILDVYDVFMFVNGRTHTFLFKAPGFNTMTSQTIGTGDGTTTAFPVFRSFSPASGRTYDQDVNWVVSGTETVTVNGVTQDPPSGSPNAYEITQAGTAPASIDFTVAPGNGLAVVISCDYRHIVRFDIDEFPIEVLSDHYKLASGPRIVIRSVRRP